MPENIYVVRVSYTMQVEARNQSQCIERSQGVGVHDSRVRDVSVTVIADLGPMKTGPSVKKIYRPTLARSAAFR
jgi:hypothetical protein